MSKRICRLHSNAELMKWKIEGMRVGIQCGFDELDSTFSLGRMLKSRGAWPGRRHIESYSIKFDTCQRCTHYRGEYPKP